MVKTGDTLYAIAFERDVDYRDLARWNRLVPPYTIYPGQSLKLKADVTELSMNSDTAGDVSSSNIEPLPAPGNAITAPLAEEPALREPVAPPIFEDVPSNTAAPSTATRPAMNPAPTALPPPTAPSIKPVPPTPIEQKPISLALAKPIKPTSTTVPQFLNTKRLVKGVYWHWPAQGAIIGHFADNDPAQQGLEIKASHGAPVYAAADGEVVYSGNGLLGYGELIIIKHSSELLSAYGYNRKRLVNEGAAVRAGQQIAEIGDQAGVSGVLHFEIRQSGKPTNPLNYLPAR